MPGVGDHLLEGPHRDCPTSTEKPTRPGDSYGEVRRWSVRMSLVGSGGDEAVFVCGDDELRAVAGAEFGEDAVDVGFHRQWAEEQPGGDLVVGQPGADQGQHFPAAGSPSTDCKPAPRRRPTKRQSQLRGPAPVTTPRQFTNAFPRILVADSGNGLGFSQVGCGGSEQELAHRVPGRAHRRVQGRRVAAKDPGPRTAVMG